MDQPIVGFHQDEEAHWVARLACGHNQHVRHDPPWQSRPWVVTPQGRAATLGRSLEERGQLRIVEFASHQVFKIQLLGVDEGGKLASPMFQFGVEGQDACPG